MATNNEIIPNIHTLRFTLNDVKALMEILQFAKSAATLLAQQEINKGFGVGAAAKMNGIVADSDAFLNYIAQSINIGEPTSEQIH